MRQPSAPLGQPTALLGIVIIVIAANLLGLKDGFAKLSVEATGPLFLAWLQYVATWVFISGFVVAREGTAALIPTPFKLQLLRGLLITVTPLQFFISTQFIPLAESHALLFTGPLLAVVWSRLLLKEHVGIHRYLAVVCGFLGILIVLRPDFSQAQIGHLFAFGAGFTQSFYFIINKRAADLSSPVASIAHSVIFGALLLAPLVIWQWPAITTADLSNLAWFALFGAVGQSLLIFGFAFGPASLLAPFHYSIIIASIGFGWLAFGYLPDALTFAGIALVISAGVYIAMREARLARTRTQSR